MGGGSWTMVDALNRPTRLGPDDICLYYYVYTPRAGYGHSEANQVVLNYKIPQGGPSGLRARPQRGYYKDLAIGEYARALSRLLPLLPHGDRIALVPMPTSRPPTDPDYDDRNVRVCERAAALCAETCPDTDVMVCRNIETVREADPSHMGGTRDPAVVRRSLGRVGTSSAACDPVILVDDVLVSGAHFAAAKGLLVETGCRARIYGLFLARSDPAAGR